MKIIAVIPARAGSKRLPGKNIKKLGPWPLLVWSIKSALTSKEFDRVIVSTEDSAIAEIAKNHGAEVPRLRSAHLATGQAQVEDVLVEVLDWVQQDKDPFPEGIMLLQPTSPFRRKQSIIKSIALFKEHGESVVSVSPTIKIHPYWCKTLSPESELLPFMESAPDIRRTQDLPPVYQVNGLIYLAKPETLLKGKILYSEHTRALIVDDPLETIDIDTQLDWLIAETIWKDQKDQLLKDLEEF